MSEFNYLKNVDLVLPKPSISKVEVFSGFGTTMELSLITVT